MPDHVVRINGRLSLLGKSKRRPSADPHVIALAVVLRARGLFGRALGIVTEEADRPDRPTRIPSVARRYGIPCINMDGLLGREGLGRRSPRGPGPAHG